MKRLVVAGSSLFFAGLLLLMPFGSSANAAYDSNTGCGLGNMLFKEIGQDKTLFQVFAVTTNGIFGNQTFGITSGTLGCSQPSKFVQNEKLEKFVADNMDSIAQDIASGRGEAVSTLAEMMEVPANDRAAFYSLLQANFNNIYTSSSVQYSEVIDNIIKVVSNS